MAKAVLVLDLKENCEDCDLFEANQMTRYIPYCYKANRVTKWKGRPKWCPLIPEPTRLTGMLNDTESDAYICGWNACLDALKGKEEQYESIQGDRNTQEES